MGGYEGGEVASSLTVAALRDFIEANQRDADGTWPHKARAGRSYEENLLSAATAVAHLDICARREGRLDRMGATVVAALVKGHSLTVAHVGDSRLYRLRRGVLEGLTRDHSYWAELEAAGTHFDRATFPYKNQITRALGIEGASSADVATHALECGDTLLLCSDGLYDPLEDSQLVSGLALDPASACEHLTRAAFDAGGTDNITAVVLRVA
jgi:serine/threonine protein phosphatase PrpC